MSVNVIIGSLTYYRLSMFQVSRAPVLRERERESMRAYKCLRDMGWVCGCVFVCAYERDGVGACVFVCVYMQTVADTHTNMRTTLLSPEIYSEKLTFAHVASIKST